MNHLDFQQAIEYLQKILPPEEMTRVTQHLPTCTACQHEIEIAQQFMNSPQTLPTPSPNLVNRVTAAFRRKQERLTNRTEQKATLQFDSWSQLVALGVRGIPQERQLLFHEDEFDLDLQVMNDRETKTYTMRGQMLGSFANDTADDLEGVALTLKNKKNGQRRQSLTDQYGRFSFSQLDQSDYELFVALKERDIIINLESLSITE
ncbi:MAG: carboxypeptidase regulatory-like domain-containing protein [Anaerolineae bacterium]|nr:carboxypeptidase regulatory-like domain-containing protein [Anaerolineae bacterium]